jgi:CheY-like chemotaxis protein
MAHETILIIDDSADTRLLLSLRLKAKGYRTVFAADALEAITRVRQAQPDAILLDLGLPGSNGFLVLERLKTTSHWLQSRSSSSALKSRSWRKQKPSL